MSFKKGYPHQQIVIVNAKQYLFDEQKEFIVDYIIDDSQFSCTHCKGLRYGYARLIPANRHNVIQDNLAYFIIPITLFDRLLVDGFLEYKKEEDQSEGKQNEV